MACSSSVSNLLLSSRCPSAVPAPRKHNHPTPRLDSPLDALARAFGIPHGPAEHSRAQPASPEKERGALGAAALVATVLVVNTGSFSHRSELVEASPQMQQELMDCAKLAKEFKDAQVGASKVTKAQRIEAMRCMQVIKMAHAAKAHAIATRTSGLAEESCNCCVFAGCRREGRGREGGMEGGSEGDERERGGVTHPTLRSSVVGHEDIAATSISEELHVAGAFARRPNGDRRARSCSPRLTAPTAHDAPIALSQMANAANASPPEGAARKVRSVSSLHILEELHLAARQREVPLPRRQKPQSSLAVAGQD